MAKSKAKAVAKAGEVPLKNQRVRVRFWAIWSLSWPNIVTFSLFSLVGLQAYWLLGDDGKVQISAFTVGFRVIFLAQALLTGFSLGVTAMIARAWGGSRRRVASSELFTGLVIGMGLAIVLAGFLFFASAFIFELLQAPLEVAKIAEEYLRVAVLFLPTIAIFLTLSAGLRAAGDTLRPMFFAVLVNLLAAALLPVFVDGAFGFSGRGAVGAALATGIAFVAGAFFMVASWIFGWLKVKFLPTWHQIVPTSFLLGKISAPAVFEAFLFHFGLLVFLAIIAAYGEAAVAAYGIGISILSISFVIGFAFSLAASTVVGQLLGAKRPAAAKRAGWLIMRMAALAMTVFALAITVFAESLAGFLATDPEIVELTVALIWLLAAMQPAMAVEFTLAGALRGAGKTMAPLAVVSFGLIGIRLTLAFAALSADFGVKWIYACLTIDYLVKSFLYIAIFKSGKWALAGKLKPFNSKPLAKGGAAAN